MTALFLTAAVVLGRVAPANAFGPTGHRIVGHLADRQLCAGTRTALQPLLAGATLADAGTWPDRIRREPEWQYTRPWHYINVSDRGSVARAAARDADNVIAAVARFERELRDTSLDNPTRGTALRFFVHFVADVHQPLHVGRAGDRGGNEIPVQVGKRQVNLHAVWDAELLRIAGDAGPRAWARRQALLDAAGVLREQRGGPLDWARESQALRPRVYAFRRAGDGVPALSPEYLAGARALVEERLRAAGSRLAGRLNAALGPPGGCPGEVASR